jgi:hypothetical protein
VKGKHLAAHDSHGQSDPLFVGLLLHKAAHVTRFHLQTANHHVTMTGDGLDVEMIRQGLNALNQKAQEPLECDPHGATDTASRNPLHQQAFDERTLFIWDKVLREAPDELASTVVTVMILCVGVDVPIFLILGRLTPLKSITWIALPKKGSGVKADRTHFL